MEDYIEVPELSRSLAEALRENEVQWAEFDRWKALMNKALSDGQYGEALGAFAEAVLIHKELV